MLKKLAILCSVVSIPMSGFASYELGLIMQGNKIHRWDPVTNVYLGSINMLVGGSSIISYQSTGQAYVLNGTNVYRYNYNTGEYYGRFDVGAGAASLSKGMNDGELLVGYSGAVRRRNVTTGAQIGSDLLWSGGGFSYFEGAIAMRSTNTYYLMAERTTYADGLDYLLGVDANSTWVGNYQNVGSAGSTSTSIRNGDVQGNLVSFLTSPTGGTSITPEFARRNGSATLTYVTDTTSFVTHRKSYLQFGHGESVIGVFTTFTSAYQVNYVRTTYDGLFGSPQVPIAGIDPAVAVDGFSMIVAPEPSSVATLFVASAGILLRRRISIRK